MRALWVYVRQYRYPITAAYLCFMVTLVVILLVVRPFVPATPCS